MKGLFFDDIKVKQRTHKIKENTFINKYYYSFGKYLLNRKKLNENFLLIKQIKSLGPVNKLKRTVISDDFKSLINDLLDTTKINIQTQKKLKPNETILLELLLNISGLTDVLNYSRKEKDANDYLDRLILIQGTFEAGNDNDDIKKEAIEIIKLLSNPNINKININDADILINSLT
jgi:hypothetical protein